MKPLPLLLACLVLSVPATVLADMPIRSETDLPTTRYPLPDLASRLYASDAFARDTLPRLRADAERLLATREIEDPSIAQRLRLGLAAIAVLQARPADASRLIAEQRAAESKPQLRAIGGMVIDALAAADAASAAPRCDDGAVRITQSLATANAEVVRDEAIRRYGRLQTASVGFHAGSAAMLVDAEVRAQGSIGLLSGLLLANMAMEARAVPPCRDALAAALKRWIDDSAHRPVDIWPDREPATGDLTGPRPVTVAIWESGFDATLFPGQIAFDPADPPDGIDNDGNGVIDDAFGPTFDVHLRPTAALLQPLSPGLAARLGLQLALEKGLLDLNYADDTPEARLAAARARDASPLEQVEDGRYSEELFAWMHGTWVAGLIAEPAPFVRLYTVNAIPFGNDPEPVPMREDDIDRWVAALPAIGARLRGADVRVVNMSWGADADEFARNLIDTGSETDPSRAKTRAEAMYRTLRGALDRMIRDCPDILFVAGAGNSNQTTAIAGTVPQTLGLPNLLVVGGTGSTGRPTAFTTYGGAVRIYAPAEGNRVRAPGGMRMRASGTSFASPFAARVAASMLAVNPDLPPARVIEGILQTATDGEDGMRLIHPGQAVRWARAAR